MSKEKKAASPPAQPPEETEPGPPTGITVHAPPQKSWPVTFKSREALEYARAGYSYQGDAGPSLDVKETAHRDELREKFWAAPELLGVPGDMRLYGLLAPGLETAFYPPYADIGKFRAVTLQAWLDKRKKES
jgi:hypothetical protein